MTTTIGIIQYILGALFVITGSFKFFQNKDKIIASGGTWAEDFAPGVIKTIAFLELLSGITLVVSKIIGNKRNLTLAAAGAIAVIMTGAIFVHLKRKEFKHAAINIVFLAMAVALLALN